MAKKKKKEVKEEVLETPEVPDAEPLPELPALIEVVGPGGRHFVKSSLLPELQRKGFMTVEEYKAKG